MKWLSIMAGAWFGRDETNSCDARLFRLNGQHFLDSCPTDRSLDELPVHQLQKVQWTDTVFEMAQRKLSAEKLAEKLCSGSFSRLVTDEYGDILGNLSKPHKIWLNSQELTERGCDFTHKLGRS